MSKPLRVGLLQCGYVHADLISEFGDYPDLFASLLAPFDFELIVYDVQHDPLPPGPTECDAWIVSGSADSTYDDLAWIAPVEQLVRDLVVADVPMVAICFGHQLLAQALGGRVAKNADGWGVGAHAYRLTTAEPCDGAPGSGSVRLIASHQDQVTQLPPGAVVVAATAHCPFAAYTLGPRVLAMQPHPEFGAGLSRRLIEARRQWIGSTVCDQALDSLNEPLDQLVVAQWIFSVLSQDD